jgi:hypothetical protein
VVKTRATTGQGARIKVTKRKKVVGCRGKEEIVGDINHKWIVCSST